MATQKHSQTHPTARQLAAFALGKLAPDGRGRMQQHLDGCPECSTFLSKTPRDTLVDLLKKPVANVPASEQSTPGVRDSSTVLPPADGAPAASPEARRPAAEKRPAAAPVPPPGPTPAKPAVVDEFVAALGEQTKYRVVRLLGHGGMGRVYEAYHERMGRRVALKVIDSPLLKHPDALRRFDQEVKAAANLDHPNLARAYDADEFGAIHVLVMEFIAGESLDKVLAKEGPMSVARACDCIRQAAAGLAHAHQQGMVHRDLKPQNLMLTPEGRIKILDFGLAKVTKQSPSRAGLTRENSLMGTPHYLAPEQALDAASADIRADIYSLGCTLYCLLAGSPPFEGDTEMKVLLAHQQQTARPLCEVRPDVPRELSDLVARMLAKNPAERPQSPEEVGRALQPFTTAPRPAKPSMPAVPVATPIASSPATVEIPFADEPLRAKGARPRAAQPAVREEKRSLVQAWQNFPPHVRWPSIVALGLAGFLFALWGISVLLRTPQGTILVENVPEDAQVLVDGEVVSVKRDRDLVTIEAVKKGEHTLKITRDGKSFWTQDVTIDFAGDQFKATYSPFEAKQNAPDGMDRTATVSASGWTIRGDELVKSPGGPLSYVFFGDSLPNDYDYRLKAKAVSGHNGFIILSNVNGAENCRWFELGGYRNTQNVWASRLNGSWKDKQYEEKPGSILRERWYELRMEVRGTRCRCFLDGMQLFDHDDGRLRPGRVGVGAVDTGVHFKDFQITDTQGKVLWQGPPVLPGDEVLAEGKSVPAPKPYVPPAGVKPINLLALIDLRSDTIGNWSSEGGTIRSNDDPNRRVQLPRVPPEEYDVRVEFTPTSHVRKEVGIVGRGGGRQFAALVGAYGDRFCGFELYEGKFCNVHPTGRQGEWLTTLRRHELVLQVRNSGATLLLDGVEVSKAAAPWSRFTLDPTYKLKRDDVLGLVSSRAVRFDKVDLYEISGTGKDARVAQSDVPASGTGIPTLPKSPPADKVLRTVDLMALVDPEKDTIEGKWTRVGKEFRSNDFWPASLRIPYQPPEEYDFRVAFTRAEGRQDVGLQFSRGTEMGLFSLGVRDNSLGGFALVNREHVDKNPTGFRSKEMLQNGRRYELVVYVRKGRIAAAVDGKLVADHPTGLSELSIAPEWGVGDGLLGVYSAASPTIIHSLAIDEITGKGKKVKVLPAGDVPSLDRPPPQDKHLHVVDLMPLIDPARDTVQGVWKKDAGELRSDAAQNARIHVPYDPPEEYDLHTVFTRTGGRADVFNVLSQGPHSFYFVLAGGTGTGGGFGAIDGRWPGDNLTAIRSHGMLRNGRPYDQVVHVRKSKVAASVDGKLVAEYVTDYSALTLASHWAIMNGRLGIGSHESPTTFHKIEIAEITGEGTPLRPAEAQGPSPDSTSALPQAMRDFPDAKVINGDWYIEQRASGDELAQNATDTRPILVFGDPAWSNYDLALQGKVTAGENGFIVSFHIAEESGNSCCLELGESRNRIHQFLPIVNGKRLAGKGQAGSLTKDVWHDVKIEVRGKTCAFKVDGIPLFGKVTAPHDKGRISVGTAEGTMARFRNIKITAPDGRVLWNGLPKVRSTADQPQAMRDYPECVLVDSGNWRIENDEMVQTSQEKVNTGISFGDPNWKSYNVHLHVKSDAGSDGFAIAWHVTGKDETLRCRLMRLGAFGNSRHDSVPLVDGNTLENEVEIRPGSVDRSSWHDVKLEIRGPQFTCYYDWQKLFDDKDERFTSGRIGLGAFATAFRFKDVEVTSPDGKTILWRGLPKLPGTSQASRSRIPPPTDAKKHGNSYYKVYPEWMTWQQARDRCLTLGGRLAVVRDRDTNDFLTGLVRDAKKEEAWLGATDEVKEGKWVWVDGSAMVYTNWDTAVQQPDNKDGAEHYLILRAGVFGKWSDQPNISTQFTPGFICQWD